MPDPFPILDLLPDSKEAIEQLGSKPKFWFRMNNLPQRWLFKFNRANTGEDWSEKVASEIARIIGLSAAQVELASFVGSRGVASKSFVERKEGFSLIHGNEVLFGRLSGYDKTKQRHQCDHTINNIFQAVKETFTKKDDIDSGLIQIAGHMMLDAIIANTDRHHENWGLIRGPWPDQQLYKVAPSFDHASSLGRELSDEKRIAILSENRLKKYIDKGRGGIYWDAGAKEGENPLQLAIKATAACPDYFLPWVKQLREMDTNQFDRILSQAPSHLMSETAKTFSGKMMVLAVEELRRL